ncbi:MAG TPA: YccF domain-containing protein [Halanaerobiales bacterium]|nr:YccF domain-containing protein [Halanaerobiales bacterium]
MSLLGNIIWIIFGGLIEAIGWVLAGILLSITIIGLPFGIQCFKIAKVQLAPFGKEIVNANDSGTNLIMNIIWIILFGWEIALMNLISALIFAITIIGIPFAKQNLKLAKVSLFPFGKKIIR